jgi:hypothetical protein
VTTHVSFEDWTQQRVVPYCGTNSGATEIPFQGWRRFKEAFAPELVARAIRESEGPIDVCIDPFGGSGTTALACQFLGVQPVAVEVNPYLADLIEAKLATYDADALARDLHSVVRQARADTSAAGMTWANLPPSFLEPGDGSRWLFDTAVAARIGALVRAIDQLADATNRRLFKVLLGGGLVDHSNVVVSGKGRRYRGNWEARRRSPAAVTPRFIDAATSAIRDIHVFARRQQTAYSVLRGDARQVVSGLGSVDLAVFSPPYPNSFDYTDVYNIELWMLGYLSSTEQNRSLRLSTLTSHVQIAREFATPPVGSPDLDVAVEKLRIARKALWSPWIPEMVGAYFADLIGVIGDLHGILRPGGSIWLVVGDSRYGGVHVPTAAIVRSLAASTGLTVARVEPFRSMRTSAQQGWVSGLSETLVVLQKA